MASEEKVLVQVRFREDTAFGEYSDALYYTQAEYAVMKEKEITAAKQERVSKWVASMQNPGTEVEPTKEELEAEKAELQERVDDLETRINDKKVESR